MLIKYNMLSYDINHAYMMYEANFKILPVFFDENTEVGHYTFLFDSVEELVNAHLGKDSKEVVKVTYEIYPFHKVYEIDLSWPIETLRYLKKYHVELYDGADKYIHTGRTGEYYKERGIHQSGPDNVFMTNSYMINTYIAPAGDVEYFGDSMKILLDTELKSSKTFY